jgi:recombination associated protein RdgC
MDEEMKARLIRNALVYKATLPSVDALTKHLEECPFTEALPGQAGSIGFIPRDGYTLVDTFHGGFAFTVRIDEKIVPAGAVRTELEKRCKEVCDAMGLRRVGKKLKAELKDNIILEFRAKALVRTNHITCFYDTKNGYLVIPTTSRTTAGHITSLLVRVVGSIKTETIHISDVKNGLTTRLTAWMDEDTDAFGEFAPCDEVAMTNGNEKLTVKMDSLANAEDALREAIKRNFTIKSMRFMAGTEVKFGLTSDFAFKGIDFPVSDAAQADDDMWLHEASVQLLSFSAIVKDLCDLLGYKEPEQEKEAA